MKNKKTPKVNPTGFVEFCADFFYDKKFGNITQINRAIQNTKPNLRAWYIGREEIQEGIRVTYPEIGQLVWTELKRRRKS